MPPRRLYDLTSQERHVFHTMIDFGGAPAIMVEQSPGFQNIWYNPHWKDREPLAFNLWMPWTRLIILEDGALRNAAHYTRWDGRYPLTGYYNPLPDALHFHSCSDGARIISFNKSWSYEEKVHNALVTWWGSNFNGHLDDDNTWSHPFWRSMKIDKDSEGSREHAIVATLGVWEQRGADVQCESLGYEFIIEHHPRGK